MLRITNAQFEALQAESLSTFEAAMLERGEQLSPVLAMVVGKDGLLGVIRAAVVRAASHGFTLTGPVRLFIELSFLFGSGFDADVQYPWARESLGSGDPGTQIGRANTLFEASMEAMGQIHGPDGSHTDAALRGLQGLISAPPQLHADDFSAVVLSEMARVHPQKCAYVGEPALRSLIAAGEAEAAARGFSQLADVWLVVLLMFAFGQGCADDPLYPWIGRTLGADASAAVRAEQLTKRALVWIRAVLAKKGVRS